MARTATMAVATLVETFELLALLFVVAGHTVTDK